MVANSSMYASLSTFHFESTFVIRVAYHQPSDLCTAAHLLADKERSQLNLLCYQTLKAKHIYTFLFIFSYKCDFVS